MERAPRDHSTRHDPATDVYYGFDTFCAALGFSLVFVGIATVMASLEEAGQGSWVLGLVGLFIGVFLLGTALLFNRRGEAGADH